MSPASYVGAPRWRQTGSGLIDVGVLAGLRWLARRGELTGAEKLITRAAGTGQRVLREQLRSPGQLLLGTRTVDRRTGRRVALWRTLALAGVGVASRELVRRLAPFEGPERRRAQAAFASESHEIYARHPQASPEREAALRELYRRHPPGSVSADPVRIFLPPLLAGLLGAGLRRRLAPTVEVLARGGRDHRP